MCFAGKGHSMRQQSCYRLRLVEFMWLLKVSLFLSLLLNATTYADVCTCNYPTHFLYGGPEIYHVHRTRENGSVQDGWLAGVRIGYDAIAPNSFYYGADLLWARGTLRGRSSNQNFLKSKFTDESVEARLGYTFQMPCLSHFTFIPFVGGGAALEKNSFVEPSPLLVSMKLIYEFVSVGFFSYLPLDPLYDIGLNVKCRYPVEIKNYVENDPDYDDCSMLVGNKWQFRVELPLTFNRCSIFGLALVPFYEYRRYGKKANFPFDFLETKLRNVGIQVKFIYQW